MVKSVNSKSASEREWVAAFNEAGGADMAAKTLLAFTHTIVTGKKVTPWDAFEEAVATISRLNTGGSETRSAKQIIGIARDNQNTQAARAIATAYTRLGLDG